jgi:F-type H+-transporting ATPase subunit delta
MKNYLIAERYAKGLSLSIPDNEALEDVAGALNRISGLYETSHDFRSVVSNPAIDREKRSAVLRQVLGREGVPAVVARLAEVMLQRGRIAVLPDMAKLFSRMADERLNRAGADVTTAVEIGEEHEARLRGALETYTGKSVRLECTVDPAVLGGVVTRIGSIVIDGSVRTRLESLKNALLSEES